MKGNANRDGVCKCRSVVCCCCDSRTGATFTGIINLVVGTGGLISLYFLASALSVEMRQLEAKLDVRRDQGNKIEQKLDQLAEQYWLTLLSYTFPAGVSFLLGISVILASVKNSELLLLISMVTSGILVISSSTISLILFTLSFPGKEWGPLLLWGGVQAYFLLVLLIYRSDLDHYEVGKGYEEEDDED